MDINELTQEDIKHIENMHNARQKGLYYDTSIVTRIYNKLLSKNENPTNCGTCIRRRTDAIWSEYNRIKDITTQDGCKTEEESTQNQGNTNNG